MDSTWTARTRLTALLLAAVVALAGCGSTVQQGDIGGADVVAGTTAAGVDGLGMPASAGGIAGPSLGGTTTGSSGGAAAPAGVGAAGGGTASGGSTAGRPGGTTGGSPATGAGSTPGAPTAGGASAPAPGPVAPAAGGSGAMGRGVTAEAIRIAAVYLTGTDAAGSAIGVDGLSTGDGRAQAEAIVADLNASGGIAGRPVELHLEPVDSQAVVADAEGTYASTCASLTQDVEVFAAVAYANVPPSFPACLAGGGVVLVDNAAFVDRTQHAELGQHFYAPGDFLLDRLYAAEVDRLVATGWLTPDTVVGLHHYDQPERRRLVEDVVKPRLAQHGIPVGAEAAITNSAAGLSQYSGAVLSFRSAGVTRVLGIAASPLLFMNAAESQGYRPAWSVDSGYGPGALLETAAPPAQLVGAAGIGWQPWSDVAASRNPGPVSANETRCLTAMESAGQRTTSPVTTLVQLTFCDGFFFLQAALDRAPDPTIAGLAVGAAALGAGVHPSAVTFATDLSSGRPDGAAAVRDVRYDEGCRCFAYTGDPVGV